MQHFTVQRDSMGVVAILNVLAQMKINEALCQMDYFVEKIHFTD